MARPYPPHAGAKRSRRAGSGRGVGSTGRRCRSPRSPRRSVTGSPARSREPTAAQAQAWPAIASGEHTLISAPTGSGKTLAAFLWGIDRLVARARAGGRAAHADRLRLAAEGALLRRRAQPRRADPRASGADVDDRRAHRRHAAARPRGDAPPRRRTSSSRRPSRSTSCSPSGAREILHRRRGGHRRRDPRGRRDQARRAPRADARAARARSQDDGRDLQRIGLSATQNPLEEIGRFLVGPRRTCRIVDAGRAQGARPAASTSRSSRWSSPTRAAPRSEADPLPVARRRRDAPLDLAGDLPGDPASSSRSTRSTIVFVNNRRGAERLALRLNELQNADAARRRAARRDRPRAPRLARARGAHGHRGAAEGGRAAVPRRDLVAGARHRHGRRRPRAPGRVAEVGQPRPAAHRPRGPRRRRAQRGPDLPEVPRRPARVRGRHAAHARGPDRADRRPAQRARRPRPADRRDRGVRRRGGAGRRRRPARARHAHPLLRRAPARAAGERARHARRALPVGRSSASCARASSGTASPGRSARARAPAGSRSRTPARSPTAACTPSSCPTGAASASSTRRWSTRRAPARRSCSARRRGGSRRSRATA